jgi:signal peptidase I
LTQTVRVQPSRVQRYHGRRLQGRRARRRFLGELPFLLLAALILTVLVKGFLVQAFFIPSRSMEPTLEVGDRVVVNRLAYRIGEPAYGDVVVFLRPVGSGEAPSGGPLSWVRRAVAQGLGGTPPGSEDLIKRVVGLPGDTVEGRDGKVWRNGHPVPEPYLGGDTFTSDFDRVKIRPGHYWVMGDNREDSADSRVFGDVPRSTLVGRAAFTVWPFTHLGGF